MTFYRLRVFGCVACFAILACACTANEQGSPNTSRTAAINSRKTQPTVATTTTQPAVATTTAAPADLSLLVEPDAGMIPIYDFMSSAQRTLDMTMYELSDPSAEQLLIADQRKGVKVRVLLDRDFSGGSVNAAAYATLSASGVQVAWANDSEIFHQKTITVDDAKSAIMTGNLTSQYYPTTRDLVVIDNQPADVSAIESVFNADWSGMAPSPGPAGADLVWSPGSEPQLAALIASANRNVTVENEEMDSTPIEAALEGDAQRGVDVTVIMTSDSDWDSAFSQLESAGVHVVLYPDTSSARYIHAKAIDVDGTTAFIGSQNFSASSLNYNRELGLITTSTDVVGPLNATLLSDASGGQEQAPSAQPHSATTSTSTPPVPIPATGGTSGCFPIDNEGGCYEPGEYCREDDHGATGRAGNGEAIACEDKNGWYWEPA